MPVQVSKDAFAKALTELGHDPEQYRGQRLALAGMCELYELEVDAVLDAIEHRQVAAHYDYFNDTICVDALDAAHFYFCIRHESHLYAEWSFFRISRKRKVLDYQRGQPTCSQWSLHQ